MASAFSSPERKAETFSVSIRTTTANFYIESMSAGRRLAQTAADVAPSFGVARRMISLCTTEPADPASSLCAPRRANADGHSLHLLQPTEAAAHHLAQRRP